MTGGWGARDLEALPPGLRGLVARATQRTAKGANEQTLCCEAPGRGSLLGWMPETYEVDETEVEAVSRTSGGALVLTFQGCVEGEGRRGWWAARAGAEGAADTGPSSVHHPSPSRAACGGAPE